MDKTISTTFSPAERVQFHLNSICSRLHQEQTIDDKLRDEVYYHSLQIESILSSGNQVVGSYVN